MEKCCGDCRWWMLEEIDHGHVCVNGDSEWRGDWREKDDGCEEWGKKD